MTERPARIPEWMRRTLDWSGPSESSALIRIGLALCLWARYGQEMLLFRESSIDWVVLCLLFWTSSTAMLVGWFSRVSTVLCGLVTLSMFFRWGLDLGREPWTHHHTYLLNCAVPLSSLLPLGDSLSVDAWRRGRSRQTSPASSPLWGMYALRLQLSAVYGFSAFDKSNLAWLSGERMQHILMWFYTGSEGVPDAWRTSFELGCTGIAVGTWILEWVLCIGLWRTRLRRLLLPTALAFHAGLYLLLPVSTFSVTMYVLLLSFVDPKLVSRGIRSLVQPKVSRT